MPFFSHDLWSEENTNLFPALQRLFLATKGCTSETFWDFEQAFEEFFRSEFLPNFLAGELLKIKNERDYDEVQSDDELEIVRGEGFRISMGKIKASSPLVNGYSEIVCYASDFMYCNLGPEALEVELFKFPSDRNIEYFERNVRPIAIGRRTQKKGEIVKARAGVDVLKVLPPSCNTFQIYAVSLKPQVPLLWHFDAASLHPKYCTSASPMSSRIQTGIDILVRMNCLDAIPEITNAIKSNDHFVRWTAIASVACMDENKGAQLLRNALNDPHPDIRSAAESALHMLESNE
jgi:hypothetical protein